MIKIVRKPKVYLASMSEVQQGLWDYLADKELGNWQSTATTSGELLPEVAGRLCYGVTSFRKPRPGGNAAYLDHIKEVGHGSVFEHTTFGLIFMGISRIVSQEITRHRFLSPSQLSQRFHDESDCRFVCPPCIADNQTLFASWQLAMEAAQDTYCELAETLESVVFAHVEDKTLRRKLARESARSVLPNNVETEVFLTGSARGWRAFLELRASLHAMVEMRVIANRVYEVLVQAAPKLFDDYIPRELPDGTFELVTDNPKI